ncbi:uncharacterized protein LOC107224656 isoform X5 [Neodiprion lecontei]|uniref:Uncharacterized protein LOC107224656 isoform X5 n=1 Tax=Neodiprion lecontei TaxID=441921 RepID=A0ABM3FNT8_NEOLC|nr:uncharacterized protein LOC107224656 isoform X5 [Neodiprion lecontei]
MHGGRCLRCWSGCCLSSARDGILCHVREFHVIYFSRVQIKVYYRNFAASVVIFFMEITWVVSLFIQVCIRNDDSLCWGCWSGVLAITGGWRRAIFYLPLSCILAWKPHRLWLSFVAAALLAVLSLLHILSSALSRRGSQLSGGADCVGESLLNTRPESYDRFEDVLKVTEVLDDGVPGSTNRMVESDGEM